MNKLVTISKYEDKVMDIMIELIKGFWLAHNDYVQSTKEALDDLAIWTGNGHKIYLIYNEGTVVGFVHLGNRGATIDWIEDLFIKPEYQGNGFGSRALNLVEEMVKEYSESIYLEVAARNMSALKLYRKNGYDCLNSITIRKDFEPENFDVIQTEESLGYTFEVKKYNK